MSLQCSNKDDPHIIFKMSQKFFLGVVHFCVCFFSQMNNVCLYIVDGWVGSSNVAIHLENQKKYVCLKIYQILQRCRSIIL